MEHLPQHINSIPKEVLSHFRFGGAGFFEKRSELSFTR